MVCTHRCLACPKRWGRSTSICGGRGCRAGGVWGRTPRGGGGGGGVCTITVPHGCRRGTNGKIRPLARERSSTRSPGPCRQSQHNPIISPLSPYQFIRTPIHSQTDQIDEEQQINGLSVRRGITVSPCPTECRLDIRPSQHPAGSAPPQRLPALALRPLPSPRPQLLQHVVTGLLPAGPDGRVGGHLDEEEAGVEDGRVQLQPAEMPPADLKKGRPARQLATLPLTRAPAPVKFRMKVRPGNTFH